MLSLKTIMTQVEAELTATASDKKAAKAAARKEAKRAHREEQVLFFTVQKALKDAEDKAVLAAAQVRTAADAVCMAADQAKKEGTLDLDQRVFVETVIDQLRAKSPKEILSTLQADAETILAKIKACTDGRDYADRVDNKYEQCLIQLYNYVELAVDSVGVITNMFGCFESLGVFVNKFIAVGYRTTKQLSKLSSKEAEFVREFASAVPIASVPDSKFASNKLAEISDAVNGIDYVKLGAETEAKALEKVRAIMHGIIYKSNWDNLQELSAIAQLMEAVKRFFQENGIDSTKQLPLLGLDITLSEQFRTLSKKSKKLYQGALDWHDGTVQIKLGVSERQAKNLGQVQTRMEQVAPGQWEPKTNPTTGATEHYGILNDATSLVRDRVMNYAINEVNKVGSSICNLLMDEQVRTACVEAWKTFQRTHAVMAERIQSTLKTNHAWIQSFALQTAKALEAAHGVENDPMYEAALKAIKEKRAAMQKTLRNQLRLEYRAHKVAPSAISQLLFGCVLANKSEYEDLESSFGSFLQEEYALFVLQWAQKLGLPIVNTIETQVDNCLLPDGYIATVDEDGLIVVDGEIVGELRDELPAGLYTIVERDGRIYAQAEVSQVLEAAIDALDASTEQGVVLKLVFSAGTNPYQLLNKLMDQQLKIVSESAPFTIPGTEIKVKGVAETYLQNTNGHKFKVFGKGKSPLSGLCGKITNGMVTRIEKETGETEVDIETGQFVAVTVPQYSVYVVLQG